MAAGICASSCGKQLVDAVDHFDGVRSGLAQDGEHDRAIPVEPAGGFVVLNTVDSASDIGDANWRPIAIGDDHRGELSGILELPIGEKSEGFATAPECSGRNVSIAKIYGVADLVDADLPSRHLIRVELHANRILLRAIDLNLRYAVHHGNALRDGGFRGFVNLRKLQRW